MTLKDTLRRLYELQKIDTNLDELEEMKGDLPAQVKEFEDQYAERKKQLADLECVMKKSFAERDLADSDIISLREKVERYKSQQLEVRNNKEYDALTREMDSAVAGIAKLEKEMQALENKGTTARTDIESVKLQITELEKTLEEKRVALAEVSKETDAEENEYRRARTRAMEGIKRPLLETYQRIRDSKRGGKAIVGLVRGACGGCFNLVPPQKVLELRQSKRIYMCEHCGRILVPGQIAEGKETAAQ